MTISSLGPIIQETQQSRVYKTLEKALLLGHFQPGDRLTVRSLTEALKTGTMPVREALQRLVAIGALEFLPNKTASVPVYTLEEFDELCDIRIQLEGFATERAAEKITRAETENLKQINKELADLVNKADLEFKQEQFLIANHRFHFCIYLAAHSRHLVPLIQNLWLRMGPLRPISYRHADSIRNELQEASLHHEQLLSSLESHNPEEARKQMVTILSMAHNWYRRFNDFLPNNREDRSTPYSDYLSGSPS